MWIFHGGFMILIPKISFLSISSPICLSAGNDVSMYFHRHVGERYSSVTHLNFLETSICPQVINFTWYWYKLDFINPILYCRNMKSFSAWWISTDSFRNSSVTYSSHSTKITNFHQVSIFSKTIKMNSSDSIDSNVFYVERSSSEQSPQRNKSPDMLNATGLIRAPPRELIPISSWPLRNHKKYNWFRPHRHNYSLRLWETKSNNSP